MRIRQGASAVAGGRGVDGPNLTDFVGESFLFLGAGATVLLQLAEPGVGQGVVDHSTVLKRPLDRLRTTMTYVYAVTLGSDEERRAVARMVNKAHVPVQSQPDGPVPYSGFDPDLQLWVAATLYKNGADLYQRFLGPFDEATADRIYQQSAVYGTALQVKAEMWPATRAEFDRYWDDKLDELTANESVRDFVYELMRGGDSPLLIRLGMPLNRFVTTGLLPARVREQLHLTWGPRRQRLFDALMTVLPPVYRLVPRPVRWLPSTYYLWAMRRRLESGRRLIDERDRADAA